MNRHPPNRIAWHSLLTFFLMGLLLGVSPDAHASTAYGTLNNFDCVNDTGQEAHGFDIELEDIHCQDITYTYDYNHYGIPRITEDNRDPAHPRVLVRYAAAWKPDGTWSAYTAIPSGPISPTDGHQFTNPSLNFGGEHFGLGYYGAPTAVRYFWLVDDGAGGLVRGPPVYVATPTFTYYPPIGLQPAVVQAVIEPPPPPEPPQLAFGEPIWVKDIKTTTHNTNRVELVDLVDPDPEHPEARNWANGEPAEVETEWRLFQTEFANADNPNGELAGAPQELPEGDEVVTRRYEFYKYTGPIDGESGEAMSDEVAPDGIHGVGTVTYNHHRDPVTGEWVKVTDELSTIEVVGEFFGAQMAGFDVAPLLGLIDHLADGELGVPYAPRRVVISGGLPFVAALASGALPDGTSLDTVTGVFSGTPTVPGVYTFTVEASELGGPVISQTYTVTIPADVVATGTIATTAAPPSGGSTAGGGTYDIGTPITVIATHNPGYAFVNWSEAGQEVSATPVYPFSVTADRTLVANFTLHTYTLTTRASPPDGGSTDGGGVYAHGDLVMVSAVPAAGYAFVNWTEADTEVSTSVNYTFIADAARDLVAHFVWTNVAAIAQAGADQAVPIRSIVTLDGSGSTDVNGDPLVYQWLLLSAPAHSKATLSGATTVQPTFKADKAGTYVVQLVVHDGFVNSAPDNVTITAAKVKGK